MKTDRRLEEYCIPFLGLKNGKHQFRFSLGKKFFEAFDYSEITDASIEVSVILEKTTTMLVFDIELEGEVGVDCDRCGEPIGQPMSGVFRLIVKFGSETGTTEDDVLVLGPAEHQVDLSQYLYEYAHLCLPARRVHERPDQCNQDVLARLDQLRAESSSEEDWIAMKNMSRETEDEEE